MMHTEKKWLWAAVALLLFFAAFAFGAGMAQVIHRFQSQQARIPTVLETDDGGQQLDASLSGVKIAEEMYAQAKMNYLSQVFEEKEYREEYMERIQQTLHVSQRKSKLLYSKVKNQVKNN